MKPHNVNDFQKVLTLSPNLDLYMKKSSVLNDYQCIKEKFFIFVNWLFDFGQTRFPNVLNIFLLPLCFKINKK